MQPRKLWLLSILMNNIVLKDTVSDYHSKCASASFIFVMCYNIGLLL